MRGESGDSIMGRGAARVASVRTNSCCWSGGPARGEPSGEVEGTETVSLVDTTKELVAELRRRRAVSGGGSGSESTLATAASPSIVWRDSGFSLNYEPTKESGTESLMAAFAWGPPGKKSVRPAHVVPRRMLRGSHSPSSLIHCRGRAPRHTQHLFPLR